MTLEPTVFIQEISDALAAVSKNYTVTAVDLDVCGISCEITKRNSDRELHITAVDDLIDMVLYGKGGKTLASGTLYNRTASSATPEELADVVAMFF